MTWLHITAIAALLMLAGCDTHALRDAVQKDDAAAVKRLLAKGVAVDQCDRYGNTPLFFARSGEVAKLLLAAGADPREKNEKKDEPIHWACFRGNVEVVRDLLDAGVPVDTRSSMPDDAPLH